MQTSIASMTDAQEQKFIRENGIGSFIKAWGKEAESLGLIHHTDTDCVVCGSPSTAPVCSPECGDIYLTMDAEY